MKGSSPGRLATVVAVGLCLCACRSAPPPAPYSPVDLETGIETLSKPLPGAMAALYRLRVPSSGGLRLSVLTLAGHGRLSVAEPFGSLLSVTAWSTEPPTRVFDMRERCQVETDGLSGILGMDSLPLAQAVRLLGGRLPALAADSITSLPGGELMVNGPKWSCAVTVAAQPWRVVTVADRPTPNDARWRLELDKHSGSLPGFLRFEHADGRWAELELSKLQWNTIDQLPALPELPACTANGGANGDAS